MPLRKQKRTLAWPARQKKRQDLYSHTHVTIDMTLYRNTQPAHTTALIQGTYYQHEPTITFAIIAHNRESRSKNSRLGSKNDRKTQWEKHAIFLPCYLRDSWTFYASFSLKLWKRKKKNALRDDYRVWLFLSLYTIRIFTTKWKRSLLKMHIKNLI